MSNEKHALIIGAGLSGLASAIAMKQIGWQVTLYEQAREHKGIGAGIVLAANAMKALDRLGVGQEVRELGAAVRSAKIRDWKGNLLVELPVAEQAERYRADSYLIHRADLQKALLAKISTNELVLGKQFVSFSQEKERVQAAFADGSSTHGAILILSGRDSFSCTEELVR
jgi:2-polyprenyl-6-methoxyphenol hydroxylase-like FAD-dependent oxidoreductase